MKFKLYENIINEEENQDESELHIYASKDGKFYIFDGTQLIEVSKQKLGKKIRSMEGQSLPDELEKQEGQENGKAGDGDGGNGGYDGWLDKDDNLEDFDPEELLGELTDETFINGIVDDVVQRQRVERAATQTALARKLNPNSAVVSAIKKNIKDFISRELQEIADEQERYWVDKNSFDDDNARKLPYELEIDEENRPQINIYIDESGSCMGPLARNLLDQCASAFAEFIDEKHPEESKIKVDWYYFGSVVSTDPDSTGGGTSWAPLKAHIKETNPDNVIILTDSDLQGQHGGAHIRIPGSLWCIFVNDKDKDMHKDFDARNYREYLFTNC